MDSGSLKFRQNDRMKFEFMATHILKTDKPPFQEVAGNRKHFEIRKDDRGFSPGDILVLMETEFTGEEMKRDGKPLVYTGNICSRIVTHIMRGPIYGLNADWVIMSIQSK